MAVRRAIALLFLLGFSAFTAEAQSAIPKRIDDPAVIRGQVPQDPLQWAHPRPRITERIDDTTVVRIVNTKPRILEHAEDRGRVADSTEMKSMFLVLRSSNEQERALESLLNQQQDTSSTRYQQWLTPDEFGDRFGVALSDIQKITDWLRMRGLTVEDVARGRRSITFRGTASQVQEAFHIEMHGYLVDGERHLSNDRDISIPEALRDVVLGVESLNDFRPTPFHSPPRDVYFPLSSAEQHPRFNSGSNHYLSPGDFAKIYGTLPLLNQNIDGKDQTIAILGLSNAVSPNDSNVINFRRLFLPGYNASNTNVIDSGCPLPGTGPDIDAEAYLDIEWSGAVAPRATIAYVPAKNPFCAADYLVQNPSVASIISASFGTCELYLGNANSSWATITQQAAAEGITVFVSTGDTGSAGCDNNGQALAGAGYGVNGYASTAYNVAVGGTQFAEGTNDSSYWTSNGSPNADLTSTSAIGYIPEAVWNTSSPGVSISATGGGISQCYAIPPWQNGPGVPLNDPISLPAFPNYCSVTTGRHRYLPDVSLSASGSHDVYLFCKSGDSCSTTTPGTTISVTGGTSASAPAFAGIQALINEKYGRQGLANYVYYHLAAAQSPSDCNSTRSGGPLPSCVFNDVTMGNNGVPCGAGSPYCVSTGTGNVLLNFNAAPGYDLATGLGSVNATNLLLQWPNGTLRSTNTTIQVESPSNGIATFGQTVTFKAILMIPFQAWGLPPTGGTIDFNDTTNATKIGSASLLFDKNLIQYYAELSFSSLSVGPHSVSASYLGDQSANYLQSTSDPVTITVQQGAILPALNLLAISPQSLATGATAVVTATLSAAAPTGGAQVSLTSTDLVAFPVPASVTVPAGQTSASTPSIVAGSVGTSESVTVRASYNGTTQSSSLTVNPSANAQLTIGLTPAQSTLNVGQTLTLTATFSGATRGAPSGSAYFHDYFNGSDSLLATTGLSAGQSGQYVATYATNALLSGQHQISVVFNGDTNYATAISNVATITVQQPPQGGLVLSNLTINPSTIVGGFSPSGVVTISGNAPSGGATVSLSSNNTQYAKVPPTVTVSPGYNNVVFPITTPFTSANGGATITATYNGTMYGAGLTVLPVAVSGVTFYPNSVTAGNQAPFTVYLTGPAGAGTSISLVSSNPSVLQVPSSLSLTTGATSASGTATTSSVGTQTSVTLTATYNQSSGSGSVSILPAQPVQLYTLNFSPGTVTGGNQAAGYVTLNANAPAGGASVSLSSTSGLIQLPANVVVPEGNWTAPFSAATSSVTSVTSVPVTASYGGVSQTTNLTLVPPLPALASLTLNPTTVNSGSQATGTITFTSPAPLGGTAVNLNTSFNGLASVTNAVVVQEGTTSASFTINTPVYGYVATATISATYNGISKSALLTIVPAGTPTAPSLVTFSPQTLTGGSNSTGTVFLTAVAPAGGAILTMTSDNAVVQVPPQVTVPAGASSTTFVANTSAVTAVSTATIAATYNGLKQSTLLTLTPSSRSPIGPAPFLASPLEPVSRVPGGPASLTVNGQGFIPGAQILWNGTPLQTSALSASRLQASIPSGTLQQNGSALVTVANPTGPSSNALPTYVTYPTTTPTFQATSLSGTGESSSVAVGDFNGDGKLDIVVGKIDGSGLSVFLGNGDGTFSPQMRLPSTGSPVIVADINGDHKLDIVFCKNSSVGIYLGTGDGTFVQAPDVPLPATLGTAALAAGDLNGDGALDLVVTGSALTQAYVLIGNGDGTFASPAGVGSVAGPLSVALADFDGDGKLDIALADTSNRAVAVLLGKGDGTFNTATEYPVGIYVYSLAAADFDGNGSPDLVVASTSDPNANGGGVAFLRNNGNGTFAASTLYGAGHKYYWVAVDDINGDGKLDLILVSLLNPNRIEALLGNGDGTFAAPLNLWTGSSLTSVAVGDMNGDGAPDVLTANFGGNLPLLVQSIAPIVQISPANLSFTATQGGPRPPAATLTLTNSGGGAASWSASPSAAWIVLGQTSGAMPSTINVTVDPSNLTSGTYTGTITVSVAGASNSPQSIPITATISAPPVVPSLIALSPGTVMGTRSVSGTVTLSAAAPVSGAFVTLASSDPSAQVPPSVTVPQGALSAGFSIATSSVASPKNVTITASYNLVSTTATLVVNPLPPLTPLAVTPSSGTGALQAFAFSFSDISGYADITTAIAQFSTGGAGGWANNCSVAYDRVNNQIYLMSDSGAGWLGPITLGAGGTLSNSQCTIDAGASSASGSGTTLTVNLAAEFTSTFASTTNVYGWVQNAAAQNSGWSQVGTWNPTAVLAAALVSPSSGTGSSRTFTFTYSDPSGYTDITTTQAQFSSGGAGGYVGNCSVAYSRASNQLYLQNDTASGWQGPLTIGGAGTVSNSQCTIDAGTSSVSGSGNLLTLSLGVTFTSSFSGTKNVFSWVQNGSSQNSGWQQVGTWNPGSLLAAAQVSPSAGTGGTQTFIFTYTDPSGYADITTTQAMFGVQAGAYVNDCATAYDRVHNQLYLQNDAGSGWQGPGTLGTAGTLSNTQCTIDLGASSANGSGNALKVSLAVTFGASFTGTKSVFSWAQNASAQTTGWSQVGTWNTAVTLAATGVTPNSGSATTQTFAFQYTDPNGYTDITTTQAMFGFTPTSYVGVCATAYTRGSNQLYLQNDNGAGWLGPMTLGTANTLSNSQCSISGSGSSATGSGTTLAVNLAVTFGAGLNPSSWQSTPSKSIFGWVQNAAAQTSAWRQLGSWTH